MHISVFVKKKNKWDYILVVLIEKFSLRKKYIFWIFLTKVYSYIFLNKNLISFHLHYYFFHYWTEEIKRIFVLGKKNYETEKKCKMKEQTYNRFLNENNRMF